MALSDQELRDRWKTQDGRDRLAKVVRALRRGESDWKKYLVGFEGTGEVENGKDLRQVRMRAYRLPGAKLDMANLQGANLCEANLQEADLWEANLQKAVLWMANLQGAELCLARLQEANIREAHLEEAELWQTMMQNVILEEAHLEEAVLSGANLQGANFWRADLTDADLTDAHLKGADFTDANLKDVDFSRADLRQAELKNTRLQGTLFNSAKLDGAHFVETTIDLRTDARVTNIESALCDLSSYQGLMYNIRRLNWEDWYGKYGWFFDWPVRLFWWVSNYGYSTKRLIGTFLLFALAFAAVYFFRPGDLVGLETFGDDTVDGWMLALRSLYFSVVTMTTLGFGDIHAAPGSIWGHVLLMIQVILGYMLLGALITRLSVLFQSHGPTSVPPGASYTKRSLTWRR